MDSPEEKRGHLYQELSALVTKHGTHIDASALDGFHQEVQGLVSKYSLEDVTWMCQVLQNDIREAQ